MLAFRLFALVLLYWGSICCESVETERSPTDLLGKQCIRLHTSRCISCTAGAAGVCTSCLADTDGIKYRLINGKCSAEYTRLWRWEMAPQREFNLLEGDSVLFKWAPNLQDNAWAMVPAPHDISLLPAAPAGSKLPDVGIAGNCNFDVDFRPQVAKQPGYGVPVRIYPGDTPVAQLPEQFPNMIYNPYKCIEYNTGPLKAGRYDYVCTLGLGADREHCVDKYMHLGVNVAVPRKA